MTHVKICGFQTAEPILAAAAAGVDAIGLVFVPAARRSMSLDQADAVLREVRGRAGADMPQVVGLFADQPVEIVNEVTLKLGLNAVQLCGGEGVGYCASVSVPIYKVIGIDPKVPISAQMPRIMTLQQRHALAGHRIVIDTKVSGAYGGTGQQFDWGIAADLARAFEITLAGGLGPENIAEAVRQVQPWGVDSSSGVETDGEKDIAKVQAFVAAVRDSQPKRQRRSLLRLFRRG